MMFQCLDMKVAISEQEVRDMCGAGHVLRGLIFGEQSSVGEKHDANLDLFSAFDHYNLNMLRACVKGGDVLFPTHASADAFRDFADTFGGFPCVDKCLARYHEQRRNPTKPADDVEHKYTWKSVPATNSTYYEVQHMSDMNVRNLFVIFQDDGYEYIGKHEDVHHFRRPNPPPQSGNERSRYPL